jgi:hypothetical protein
MSRAWTSKASRVGNVSLGHRMYTVTPMLGFLCVGIQVRPWYPEADNETNWLDSTTHV